MLLTWYYFRQIIHLKQSGIFYQLQIYQRRKPNSYTLKLAKAYRNINRQSNSSRIRNFDLTQRRT